MKKNVIDAEKASARSKGESEKIINIIDFPEPVGKEKKQWHHCLQKTYPWLSVILHIIFGCLSLLGAEGTGLHVVSCMQFGNNIPSIIILCSCTL